MLGCSGSMLLPKSYVQERQLGISILLVLLLSCLAATESPAAGAEMHAHVCNREDRGKVERLCVPWGKSLVAMAGDERDIIGSLPLVLRLRGSGRAQRALEKELAAVRKTAQCLSLIVLLSRPSVRLSAYLSSLISSVCFPLSLPLVHRCLAHARSFLY